MTDSEIKTSIGQRIRELRADRAVAGLSASADISGAMWYAIEKGQREPSLRNLVAISRVLGVKPSKIVRCLDE